MGNICPSCKASRPSPRDLWLCMYCDAPICDQCYPDHTDTAHFADLYPELHKKRETEACDDINPANAAQKCTLLWGHDGSHERLTPDTEDVWPRT